MPAERVRLTLVVSVSVAFVARNVVLALRGGGVTPRWLLGVETTAFGAAAACGLAELGPRRRRSRCLVPALSTALVTHAIRLMIFLRRRPPGGR